LCHCNSTYRDLVFLQVCIDATPKNCSTGQGRIASPLSCAAMQTRLTAALCHCNSTYGDLVFLQVCIDAKPKHCSTGQGRIGSPLFSAALQTRLTAALCHCNSTYGDLVFTQVCSDATPKQHWSGQNRFPTVQCCSAKQAHSLDHVTVVTPMQICSSYRCAVSQHQCSAALLRAK